MYATRARLTSMHENTRHNPLDACDRVSRDLFEGAESLLRDDFYIEDVCGVARDGDAYSAAQIERVYSVWASRRCAHSERLRLWVADYAAYRVLDARADAMFRRAESSRGLDAVLLREQAHLLRARGLEMLACCMRTFEFDTSITARHIDIAQYAGRCTLVKEYASGAREVMGEFESRRAACKWLVESRDISCCGGDPDDWADAYESAARALQPVQTPRLYVQTAEHVDEVRAMLRPVGKAHGVRLSVRKGRGSVAHAVMVSLTRAFRSKATPALRIAVCEALIDAGYESVAVLHGGYGARVAGARAFPRPSLRPRYL